MEFKQSLHTDVQAILNYVGDKTNKGIKFIEKPNLGTYAIVKTARSTMDDHIIIYRPEHNEIINHLIAHECGHILRIYETPSTLRVMPIATDNEIKESLNQIRNEIENLTKKLGDEKANQIIDMMYDGLVKQLTNQPVDLMIEKWIFENYPSLRQIQLESLLKQNRDAVAGQSKELKKLLPNIFYKSSNLMNAAYTDLLSKVVKFKLNRDWKKTEFFEHSKTLSEMLNINSGWDPEEDKDKIDQWAEELHLKSFYRWRNFEDIPTDYITNY